MAKFKWGDDAVRAAELVAEDKLNNESIAASVGISRSCLDKWKRNPEFMARVDEHLEDFKATVRRRGIAQLERRVEAINDRWDRMRRVMEERADSAQMKDVPGGQTGLLVHTVKGVGKGDDFQLIDLYEVDTGLLKEFREHEKQAAQELGQWTEKVQSEVRATFVDGEKQRAMLGNERAIELACDLDAEISWSRSGGDDPGGVRESGE